MARLLFFQIFHLSFFIIITLLVYAQNQLGFISIDCGASEGYRDGRTGINYISDAGYIDTGESKNISSSLLKAPESKISQRYQNVRSFPEGIRNCYKLTPRKGKHNKYLIRASFVYGNYDGFDTPPEFDLYLGVNKWRTVKLKDSRSVISAEIVHVLQSDYIHICLVRRIGHFTPFISALEMRPLGNDTYVTQSGSLELLRRFNCGSRSNKTVRFKDDIFDRIWEPLNFEAWNISETSDLIEANSYKQPSLVMQTAVTPKNESGPIGFVLNGQGRETDDETILEFYLYLHLSEVKNLMTDDTRDFDIYINGTLWFGPTSPSIFSASTIYSKSGIRGSSIHVVISPTQNSTLPPLLNAFEVYTVKHLPFSQTHINDVDAITGIKLRYEIIRNWQGDPCEPRDYMWEGLNCSYYGSDPPRITFLDLSSSGLTGEIDQHIQNFTLLEKLDLSHNNLSGNVPDFLALMPSLKLIYLDGNNFSGSLPQLLAEKIKNGSIILSGGENSNRCLMSPCKNKEKDSKKIIIIVTASVGGFLLLLVLASAIIFWCLIRKRKKQSITTAVSLDSLSIPHGAEEGAEIQKQHFSYSDILTITTNFERIIGKGGFGTVYHGLLSDHETQVAVKMLSHSTAQGFNQFNAEAKILTRVHHVNLTAIIGYCNEGPNMGLVYEYMPNGDLASHLSGESEKPLSWRRRLNIAIDASEGLEYLHSGCKPAIIHRDVKSTNILINEKMQAKLSDFGLSRAFSLQDDTHVSTIVAGTPGYLDPLYCATNRLTEKSDVFSFGVVLLEIITGRPAISKRHGQDHVIEWVNRRISDVKNFVDSRLERDLNENSVRKAVEIAMACVDLDSTKRPFMGRVVVDLKLCLKMDLARDTTSDDVIGSAESEMMSINPDLALFAR